MALVCVQRNPNSSSCALGEEAEDLLRTSPGLEIGSIIDLKGHFAIQINDSPLLSFIFL